MKEQKRYLGIDLLRIVSMSMIAVLHTLCHGGILMNLAEGTFTYHTMWLLEYAAFCAVNCFALISGFVGYDTRHRPQSIVMLWLQVVFYTVTISVAVLIFKPSLMSLKLIANAFFPVTRNQYWYFSAYFPLFFIMPLLDAAVRTVPQNILRRSLLVIYGLFGFASFFGASDVYHLSSGYSLLWLAYLYVLGAYIRKYQSFSNVRTRVWLGLYAAGVLLVEFSAVFASDHKHQIIGYVQPSIMLSGIALFFVFRNLQCKKLSGVIRFLTPTAFAVYLIHTHPLIWNGVLANRFLFCTKYPLLLKILAVLGIAFGIYAVCTLIELLRIWLFQKLRIKEAVEKVFSLMS